MPRWLAIGCLDWRWTARRTSIWVGAWQRHNLAGCGPTPVTQLDVVVDVVQCTHADTKCTARLSRHRRHLRDGILAENAAVGLAAIAKA
jgi:hypothetical protein